MNAVWPWRSMATAAGLISNPEAGRDARCSRSCAQSGLTGATPVAATNCLNFGNPEKPEIMAQLSAAIDGIAEACTALGTPITGGNVSLYNETRGEGIYPTPVLGHRRHSGRRDQGSSRAFSKRRRRHPVLLWPIPRRKEPDPNLKCRFRGAGLRASPILTVPCSWLAERFIPRPWKKTPPCGRADCVFGSSEYASVVLGGMWGQPPDARSRCRSRSAYAAAVLAERQADSFRARHL
jgi:hypothetical protein